MNKWRLSFLLSILAFSSACSSSGPRRAQYDLQKSGTLVASNSPSFDQVTIERLKPGWVRINYAVFLENPSGGKQAEVDSNAILLRLGEKSYPMKCYGRGTTAPALAFPVIAPGAALIADCVVELDGGQDASLRQKDYTGEISIPVKGQSAPLKFKVLLLIEDFKE